MWHVFFFFRSKIREQSFSTSSSCCGVVFFFVCFCLGCFYSPCATGKRVTWHHICFFARFQDWFIQIFWNVDLMVSFLTGYYDEGALIFSLPKIALHYAKTWLLFDLSLLSMDWTFRIMVPWKSQPEKVTKSIQILVGLDNCKSLFGDGNL